MNDPQRSKWILLATSILVSVVVAEIGLRIGSRATLFLDSRANDYWRVRLHETSARNVGSATVRYDEVLGWRMNPLLRRAPTADGSSVSIGPASGEGRSQSQRRRILSIGDSYTFGLGVDHDLTFTSLLDRAADTEAFNAGTNSYGLDQSILLWEAHGSSLEPDVVVLGYLVDGFFRSMLHTRDKPKPYFEFDERTKAFRLHNVPVPDVRDPAIRAQIERAPGWRLPQAVTWAATRARKHLGHVDRARLERGQALSTFLLLRLRDSVEASGARLVVAILGTCQEFDHEYRLIEDAILDTCRAHRLECLNTAEAMRARGYASHFGQNCHFSKKGHDLVAQELAATLGIQPPMAHAIE